jgi:hypothetical protein
MTAEYIPGVEHSFLSDPACPEAFVPYEIYSDPSDESIAAQLLSDRVGSQIRIAFDGTLVVRPTLRSWWSQLVRELGFHNPYPGVLQIKNLQIVPAASAMPPT